MRTIPGRDLPAPEPQGVRARRTGASANRRSRTKWAPAVLLSAGLLAIVGLEATTSDDGLPVAEVPETSVPDATVPPPDATVPEAPPSSSDPAPGSTEPAGSEPDVTTPETTAPESPGSTDPQAETPATTTDPATETTEAPDGAADPPPVDDGPTLPSTPTAPDGGWPVRAIRFPVAGVVSFSDDWGDCRGGSDCPRRHIGNDIIGSRLQPLLATTDGTVTHFVEDHPTAGWGLVVTDAEGWEYRYYHVNNDTPGTDDGLDDGAWRYAAGITLGAPVKAGQVIAFMGDSGNSESSVPHVHFEIHRPDGTPVDPYASLRTAELLDRCAGTGDPFANAIFPVAAPPSAQQTVLTRTGRGYFLVGRDGAYVPNGDAMTVGDPSHSVAGFSCDTAGSIVTAAVCSDVGAILATIRQMESGGDYRARAAKATASGAYQYLDSTWNGFGGYGSAWQAPPAVQDARALEDVQRLLDQYGDAAVIPVAWYWPRALSHPEDLDLVPHPGAGNRLTVRQYQQRWFAGYAAQRASTGGSCPD